MKKALSASHLSLGVCYYPEHWPETLWEDDFRRMRAMGLDMMRYAHRTQDESWALVLVGDTEL